MQVRLNKFLAQHSIASRRKCDELIQSGVVAINGKVVRELGLSIDPGRDKITCKGRSLDKAVSFQYVAFHKPIGYVVSQKAQQEKTVYDVFPFNLPYVGRLDKNTSGLLLFTNHGELGFRLTHPRYKVTKKYLVTVDGPISQTHLRKLQKGIALDDGVTAPATASVVRAVGNCCILSLCIREGRKRQVRRMVQALGMKVLQLQRIQFGCICLGKMQLGQWRRLSKQELTRLLTSVGLA